MLAALVPLTQATAEPLRLGPEDRVEITVFGRPDLSAKVKVDGDGNVRLPLLGTLSAAGLSVDELEARVVAACRKAAGQIEPRVTVSVPEPGPVFIGGAVHVPGRYPWAADLTAAKAYVLAGGAPRLFENTGPLVSFEAYRALEQEEQTLSRLAAATLRQARLRAEAASAETFEAPNDAIDGLRPAQAAELLARERHLFAKRREALKGELDNLRRQSDILAEQERALTMSLEKKRQQKMLLQQELAAISGEREARLVPVTRLLALRRLIVETENDERDIERRISEARLQAAIAQQATANLINAREIEASAQLADVEREIVTLSDSIAPVRRRAHVGRMAIGASAERGRHAVLSFTLRREVAGKVELLPADADTRLLPRDFLEITAEPDPYYAERTRYSQGQPTAAVP